jgi:hypothetical protein
MITKVLRGIGIVAGAAALAVAVPASAGAGNGIRLGGSEGTLHPFLDFDATWDSNAYATSSGSASDLVLHVRPGVRVNVPGDTIALDARAAVERVQYLGISEPNSRDLSDWWADAGLRLSVNRKGRVGFEIRDSFRRSNQAQALSLATPAIANYNSLALTLPFTPAGGALIFAVGGDWAVEAYEAAGGSGASCDPTVDPACDSANLSKFGYNEVQGRASAIWRFLPRTKATFDVGYFNRIPKDEAFSPAVSGVRAFAGLSGLVTTQFGATIRAGYGATFGDAAFKTWLATVEGEWLPVSEASVRVGYTHGLGTDPGRAYAVYQTNRLSLDGKYQFARRITVQGGVRYDMIAYEAGTDTKTNVLTLEPSIDAEIAKWMSASVGYSYAKRSSEGASADLPTFSYDRHQVFIRASLTY